MKRHHRWQVALALGLVALSALFYGVHFLIFHDWHHIAIYFVGDVAFVPVEVLLVTLIIHRLLERHEKHARLRKMHMAIGTFFSEIGNPLLRRLSDMHPETDGLEEALRISSDWGPADFRNAARRLRGYRPEMDVSGEALAGLCQFLHARRDFLLNLLANPNLLEHEAFTDLLWAIFHLNDELEHRDDVARLPESDLTHLKGDIRRVYGRLLAAWVQHMRHLQQAYPYLYSLAVRANPFAPQAEAVVRG